MRSTQSADHRGDHKMDRRTLTPIGSAAASRFGVVPEATWRHITCPVSAVTAKAFPTFWRYPPSGRVFSLQPIQGATRRLVIEAKLEKGAAGRNGSDSERHAQNRGVVVVGQTYGKIKAMTDYASAPHRCRPLDSVRFLASAMYLKREIASRSQRRTHGRDLAEEGRPCSAKSLEAPQRHDVESAS